MNLQRDCYNPKFSHIYVEKAVYELPKIKEILNKFGDARVVVINHYKDLFNRRHQDYCSQHKSQALILAAKTGNNIYEGAKVCQSFDNEYFYYTSCAMNCIFDCDYCYLKGMYPSGNLVIFVNLEDTFSELELLLQQHPVYLCVSYDTDLMALEDVTGFVKKWCHFTEEHPDLKIEIRTKSGRTDIFDGLTPCDRVIFAYTLSPEKVACDFEHGAGSLSARVKAARLAMEKGFTVRLCFDPMIYCKNWQDEYKKMLDQVEADIDLSRLLDVSVGSFRISQEYMKLMRKNMKTSALVQFPYENKEGVYQYPDRIREAMENYLISRLTKKIPQERIFTWE